MNELRITLVVRTGVGKTSLIHALFDTSLTESQEVASLIPPIPYVLVDTPGFHDYGDDNSRWEAIEAVLNRSDIILFVVNSSGLRYKDQVIADRLHRFGKPVVVVINKIDMYPSEI